MRNPLNKRLSREFAADASKYIAIFIMMILLISICSGIRVGNESLKAAYHESFELYHLEDGHITFNRAIPQEVKETLEEKMEAAIEERLYIEEAEENGANIRIYKQTDALDNPCLLEGSLPNNAHEIAIDRVFAQNNDIVCGETITVGQKELLVSGFVALPDYSTLFEKNTDSMFDSIHFSVAVMTEEGFEAMESEHLYYNYAWAYKHPCEDDAEAAERSEKFLDVLKEEAAGYDEKIMTGVIEDTEILTIEDYLPRYLNQAVTFSIEDIGGDEAGTMIICYLMIGVIAFIFAVTISNTIVSEAGVIGTLRASGYTKGELIRHYMILPVIVTLVAAVIGNVLGYTVLKDYCVKLYLDSYSLTTYETLWNPSAFVISTVVPIALMLVINLSVLTLKLRISPLKFLRHDLKKNRHKKAMRLNTKIPFKMRFSIRIFFTNLSGYVVMIIGILFGAVLISFGDMLPRILDSYRDIVLEDMICKYQYVLTDYESAEPLTDTKAEKYASLSFDYTQEGFLTDAITVYGVEEDSRYVPIPKGKIYMSTGVYEKFGLQEGDSIKLDEKYKKDSSYELVLDGVYDYRSSLAVFMNMEDFNKMFGKDAAYFSGYFSDTELDELKEENILRVMTRDDYTKLSDQLTASMGGVMDLFKWFGAIFFVIVVYVLSKQVIERNFQSIAMTKILGYRNSEIARLYILSTSIAVLIGLLAAIPFVDVAMRWIFKNYLYMMMTGYIPYIMEAETYVVTFVTGLVCYVIVALLQMRKVSKVEKSEALKNVE